MVTPPSGDATFHGFDRRRRMRRRCEYQVVYEQGRRAHGQCVVVFGRQRMDSDPWRLGLTAIRRVGGAVKRNRVRRLGREVMRHWAAQLPAGWDFVLNFKQSSTAASLDELRRDLLHCLRRLGVMTAPPRAAAPADGERGGSGPGGEGR